MLSLVFVYGTIDSNQSCQLYTDGPLVVAVAQAATGKDINLEYAFPRNAYSIELREAVRMLGLEVAAYEQIFDATTSVPKEVEVRECILRTLGPLARISRACPPGPL